MTNGILISPALVNIEAGSNYELTLQNLTGKKVVLEIYPVLLTVNSSDNKLILASDATVQNSGALSEYLGIETPRLTLDVDQKTAININFKKEYDGFFLGTAVRQNGLQETSVGVAGQLISSIVPSKLAESQITQLGNGIEALPTARIAGINIGNVFDISSQIQNDSDRAIRPSAEVTMYFGEKRIDNSALTSKLPNQLLPKTSARVESRIVDNRPFWQRLGYHNFQQTLQVDGRSLVTTQEVLSLPLEFLGVTALLLTAFTTTLFLTIKRFRRGRFEARTKTAKILR
jgi:hypothetical protein